ncbi:unnamed protein product [Rotaria sp. Silwood2]|nr:unnamed protein product [Rotaria sp. Silwood2]CAF4565798.1 unnamed protein product [Rotaria sp. Silwood2]
MKLNELLENVEIVSPIYDTDIDDICTDPSQLKENSLFLITGEGRYKMVPYTSNMLQSAILKHTGFILWDSENWPKHEDGQESYRYIHVKHYRKSCAQICSNFYGQPSKNLLMIGVTGTNGKTSTTYIIERILEFSKLYRPLLIGTLDTRCCSVKLYPSYTTPYCDVIQKLLRTAVDQYHADSAIMEVSARGLDQERVGSIAFDVSICTNLTPDHLGYHGTFDQYRQAKTILFEELAKSFAIINGDDDNAQHFIDKAKKIVKVITYGIARNDDTDIYASNIQLNIHCLKFDINISTTNIAEHIHIPFLIGKTNVYNSLAALACAHLALNIPLDICKNALVTMPPISGRLEFVTERQDPITVIIDSAHTPDSFKEILNTIRDCAMATNKLICLFGCPGKTSRANYLHMTTIAQQLSDKVIITTDDTTSENPKQLIEELLPGFSSTSDSNDNVIVEIDRREAIKKAILSITQDGDILVILGKRFNISQMLESRMIDFDDRTIVKECIQQRIQHNS